MKKLTSLLLALLMLMGMMSVPAMASDEVSVYLFGEKLEFDVPPQIINGRTLVPMRKIFESLGYEVDWDKESKTAIATREGMTIRITENSYTMYVNGEAKTLDVAPCIVKGRTMVPARAISESSGYKVDWDKNTRSVLITKRGESNNPLDKETLTTIGDYKISRAVYNCFYSTVYSSYAQYEEYLGENWINEDLGYGMPIGEMIKKDVKTQIEKLTTGAVIAKKYYGITLDDVRIVIDECMKEMERIYNSKEELDEVLSGIDSTETALETYFGMFAILDLLLEKTSEDGKVVSVSDAEAEKSFNQEYAGKIKVQHILVATESLNGYTPARPDSEAKSIVNEILIKLKNGEDFSSLINFYNEDPGQTRDSYYVFGDGEMVAEFEAASKKLSVGKYTTQAVKTDYGYHIIKRYPLDKESEEYQEIKMNLVQGKLIDFIEREVAKVDIKWNN